jgi:hypothetical protein
MYPSDDEGEEVIQDVECQPLHTDFVAWDRIAEKHRPRSTPGIMIIADVARFSLPLSDDINIRSKLGHLHIADGCR